MGKYLLIIGALGILAGFIAAFALRPSPVPVNDTKPMPREAPSPTVAPIAPEAPPVAPSAPSAAIPDAPVQPSSPAPEAAAPVSPAAAASPTVPVAPPAAVPERAVVGNSPYPAGGKPTGPFDIAWSFSVGTTGATGVITVKQLASATAVSVGVVARGAASLKQPFQERVEIPQGESRSFPVAVDLGTGSGSLVVTVTAEGADRRARAITIDLVAASEIKPGAPAPGAESGIPAITTPSGVAPDPSVPLSGSRTIRDDSGEVIELNPSTPPPK